MYIMYVYIILWVPIARRFPADLGIPSLKVRVFSSQSRDVPYSKFADWLYPRLATQADLLCVYIYIYIYIYIYRHIYIYMLYTWQELSYRD